MLVRSERDALLHIGPLRQDILTDMNDRPDAREALARNGRVATNAETDTPLPELAESGWTVTDQSPESGARVPPGSAVSLWLRRDGGTGVREPRRPRPPLRSIPELPEP